MAVVLAVLVGLVYAAGGWYSSGRIDSGALALTPDAVALRLAVDFRAEPFAYGATRGPGGPPSP